MLRFDNLQSSETKDKSRTPPLLRKDGAPTNTKPNSKDSDEGAASSARTSASV
jgi:hypothetical protein